MTSLPSRPAPRAPWVGDAVLALAVTVVLCAVITISQAAEGRPVSLLALLFAAGFGAVLLLRRRLPVGVLVLSALGTFAYYTLDLPTIGVALPVLAALSSAAEQGRLRWAVGVGAVVVGIAMGFRVRDDPQPLGILLGTDAMTNIALSAAGIALGHAVASHRERTAQQAQIARLHAEQERREAELRLREEQERISRELHDTVGHALAVISLHSGVAAEAVGHDDDTAERSLAQVREQATQSLAELRALVRLLRADPSRTHHAAQAAADGPGASDDGAGEQPAAARQVRSLDDLTALLDPARAAGLRVHERVEVAAGDLSPAVHSAAYRIVQESVTNVLRHADASRLEVTARLEGGRLRLEVADDGAGTQLFAASAAAPAAASAPDPELAPAPSIPSSATDGVGLRGMAERARLLGGGLSLRSVPEEGFTVTADLPARLGAPAASSAGAPSPELAPEPAPAPAATPAPGTRTDR